MKKFDMNYENEIETIYQKIIDETKKYFNQYGFKKAVLGLSGGLDSTISAVILADILGAENVFAIFMPSTLTTTESKIDACDLVKNLRINYQIIPIKNLVENYKQEISPMFEAFENKGLKKFEIPYTMDNIQARIRANLIWAVSNEFKNTIPIATSDKSECYMGYATINGDMSGGFCPLADVLKTQLFALGNWINKKRGNVIPENILKKPPMAELAINPKTGEILKAEEALMPYPFMDEVIFRLEEMGQTLGEMMNEEFYFEKENKISKDVKKKYLEKFASRARGAVFKWGLLPEVAKISENSLNKPEKFKKLESLLVF